MRILVVEDDSALADLLARCLREEAYAVDIASDGHEAEWAAFETPYDLIILDLMLPRKNGMDVLRELRSTGRTMPVLILTAKDAKNDLVAGLDEGADDYLTKPFSLDEISARVRALLRRRSNITLPQIEAGPISINPARKEIHIAGELVEFTAKEYGLLEYFARNFGTVLTRMQLSEHVWDINFEPTSNVVDVYVGYLRTKIAKVVSHPMIKTVRGHGYMLDYADADSSLESAPSEEVQTSH